MESQEAIKTGFYPKDAKEALERWDKGELVWSIEMGGLGPGYEQAIQVGIFETIRRVLTAELPEETDPDFTKILNEIYDKALRDAIDQPNLKILHGLSGAQAGAIKNTAYQFVKKGWAIMDEVDVDRHIQVERSIP